MPPAAKGFHPLETHYAFGQLQLKAWAAVGRGFADGSPCTIDQERMPPAAKGFHPLESRHAISRLTVAHWTGCQGGKGSNRRSPRRPPFRAATVQETLDRSSLRQKRPPGNCAAVSIPGTEKRHGETFPAGHRQQVPRREVLNIRMRSDQVWLQPGLVVALPEASFHRHCEMSRRHLQAC